MSETDNDVEAQLPLTPLSFLFLLVLADTDRHGYAITREIELLTLRQAAPNTGPVYLAAARLLELGLIAEAERRPDPEYDDKRRRYYTLTGFGRNVLAAEADRMARLVKLAADRNLIAARVELGEDD